MTTIACTTVSADAARRMFLGAQGLLDDPERRVTSARVLALIERMGFVQIDTISVVARAHHHILLSRLDDYQPAHLTRLLERDRTLFEHWTHDASIIPCRWYPYWKRRFERYRDRGPAATEWWAGRMGGDPQPIIDHVLGRITDEGPLMSRDFTQEHPRPRSDTAWWGWRPTKAALEFLWRTGQLAVAGRVNFHKVYDLAERVFPDLHDAEVPDDDAHVAWAARTALERLGCGTPTEIAAFYRAVPSPEMTAWCRAASANGDLETLHVETADGSAPRTEYALPGWRRNAERLPDPPSRMRILSPFDPVLRDRHRAKRRFGFEYRFEAFVPAAKRRYGYYVLPLLEGDHMVGRLDAKLHRDESELEVRGLWWEPKVRATKARRAALDDALGLFAAGLGASYFSITADA